MSRGPETGAVTPVAVMAFALLALTVLPPPAARSQDEPEPPVEREESAMPAADGLEAGSAPEEAAEEGAGEADGQDLEDGADLEDEDVFDPDAGLITPDFADTFAEGGAHEVLPVESAGTIRTVVGAARLMTFEAQIARLAMANDRIARVQVISGREVLLTPLRPGRTTLYIWLAGGRRLRHVFQVDPNVELAEVVLQKLHPDIEIEAKGAVVILRGAVSDQTAEQAVDRVRDLVKNVRVIDLMSSLHQDASPDERLRAALQAIDERIEVRRIQVGAEPQPDKDTYILEGRVKSVAALVQAMTVAERQLGDTEIGVVPVEGGQELALRGFAEGEAPVGLAALISRGLDLMSPSGRVISFLEVDELPQILVRVKVMEIDRSKIRNLGLDFNLGTRLGSGSLSLPPLVGAPGVPIDFVDSTLSITAFIDFLENRSLARSVIEPAVLTLSGEQASIVVGGQIPIPTTATNNVSTVQGFRFQEFGVSLSIRPTLIEGDIIALDVAPSVSRPTGNFDNNNNNVPAFTFQNVRTTARLHIGQSLVVGGLLSFNETLDQTNLPWLRKLPIFNSKRRSRAETELLFVITPRFISIDPAEPLPPLPTVDLEQLELGPLEWPHDRDKWNDPFEPQEMWPDGVPPSLRRIVPGPVRRLEDDLAQEVELAPDVDLLPEIELMADGGDPAGELEAEAAAPVEPGPEVRFVSADADPCLNLRPEPTRWFAPQDCLPPGTRLLVLGEEDLWSRVAAPSGLEGWVATRFLVAAPGYGAGE